MIESKKYQANTPLTLQILADVLKGILPSTSEMIEDMIEPPKPEPPKPEPKDGELWLIQDPFREGSTRSAYHFGGKYYYAMTNSGEPLSQIRCPITPIKRLIPPEDES